MKVDKEVLSKKIGRISEDVEKLKNTLAAIGQTDLNGYPENYKQLTTDAALRSELITCRLRRLLVQTADVKKADYLASAGVVQGIQIEEKDGVLKITLPSLLPMVPVVVTALLYGSGYVAQLIHNYREWQSTDGRSPPKMPSAHFFTCLQNAFSIPYGIVGFLLCICLFTVLIFMIMKMGWGDKGEYDKERNFTYSEKGIYGTAGFMNRREAEEVLQFTRNLKTHTGTVLGITNGEFVCVPQNSRLNKNVAVYGASGSMKTRAYCINRILQAAAAKESLILCDPKSELYETTSEYLREKGYTVQVFNLVNPDHSDSWNCLTEIQGDELMAQLFSDVIIKNTGSERGDHFWDSAEANLLKALVLYVEQGYSSDRKNIGEVYKLLTLKSDKELNSLFDMLPPSHPARAPFAIYRQASDTVRTGVIIGLGSRLQVFQMQKIRDMTSFSEIDLCLPGIRPCAYYCITSDQDSTFDFLSSLFLSFCFIKLVRYADKNCEGGKLPNPVHVLGEELTACGVIPDLSRKISVIRSRNISMSCVFQNLAGLQNRYPQNQWQEILGNSDTQLFLGCVDELTAKYISDRSGEISVAVRNKSRILNSLRVSDYTTQYRETEGTGKRKLLTMDEVLRLPVDQALIIMRGKKLFKVEKCDYTKHPEAQYLKPCKASAHTPEWAKHPRKPIEVPKKKTRTNKEATQLPLVLTDKDSIMSS